MAKGRRIRCLSSRTATDAEADKRPIVPPVNLSTSMNFIPTTSHGLVPAYLHILVRLPPGPIDPIPRQRNEDERGSTVNEPI
jgi:hypothetical protein